MIKGGGNMGIRKHHVSGVSQYSPAFKHAMKLKAENNKSKKRKSTCKYTSVRDAISAKR